MSEKPSCPRCSSLDLLKNGLSMGRQRYRCRPCGRQFGSGEYLHGGYFGAEVMADAVRQYYLGMTYRETADFVMGQYDIKGTKVAPSTIRMWVRKFTDAAVRRTETLSVSVGGIWFLDSSMLIGAGLRCWQVIDESSRYLIAMDCLGEDKSLPFQVMDRAMSSAKARPKVLVCRSTLTDRSFCSEIFNAIKKEFPDVKVVQSMKKPGLRPDQVGPDGQNYRKGTAANRLRKLKGPADVQLFVRGWGIAYNFIEYKPLDIAPPGLSVAGKAPFSSWSQVVEVGEWK